jgi:hypothetical protein
MKYKIGKSEQHLCYNVCMKRIYSCIRNNVKKSIDIMTYVNPNNINAKHTGINCITKQTIQKHFDSVIHFVINKRYSIIGNISNKLFICSATRVINMRGFPMRTAINIIRIKIQSNIRLVEKKAISIGSKITITGELK